MTINKDTIRGNGITQTPQHAPSMQGWKELTIQQTTPARNQRRRIIRIVSVILLIMLIFAAIRMAAVAVAGDDQLFVHIGNQQTATIDLRQSQTISPYLLGTNVFPKSGTNSVDAPLTGTMNYDARVTDGLQNVGSKLLRFPGGPWGEEHILSLDQLSAFSVLLSQTHADGMLQAHLSGPVNNQPNDVTNELGSRSELAARWVSFMNNRNSSLRSGQFANAPFHPVKYWSVGDAPDQLVNPLTGKLYTVADYVIAFIQFSSIMHETDPTIQVFGPEISQFDGVGVGPLDATGQLWMDGFLKGVSAYEQAHPNLQYHLLDGIAFHSYPPTDASRIPALLLSSPSEWDYLLPPLRSLIHQDFGRDIPIAITEINANQNGQGPSQGLSSLWWADTLGTLLDQQVTAVNFFAAEGAATPYPLFTNSGAQQTPMFRVMQLFTHLQRNLVPLSIQHEPISIYATQDDTHQTVSLLLINKANVAQLAQVSSQNELFSVSPWHGLDISLAGYSMVLVTLHRDGGAEAYSYDVPLGNSPTASPLTYTVCGHKADALASSVPC